LERQFATKLEEMVNALASNMPAHAHADCWQNAIVTFATCMQRGRSPEDRGSSSADNHLPAALSQLSCDHRDLIVKLACRSRWSGKSG
jgi:hypothetical protein